MQASTILKSICALTVIAIASTSPQSDAADVKPYTADEFALICKATGGTVVRTPGGIACDNPGDDDTICEVTGGVVHDCKDGTIFAKPLQPPRRAIKPTRPKSLSKQPPHLTGSPKGPAHKGVPARSGKK